MLTQRIRSLLLALYLVLGTWKGYVALFDGGEEEPKQFFPTPVSALPAADQEALKKGIVIRSQRQLQQLLEDYLS